MVLDALHVVVVRDLDLRPPVRDVVAPGRQGLQERRLLLGEHRFARALALLERARVQLAEQLHDGGVEVVEAEERAVAQHVAYAVRYLVDVRLDGSLPGRPADRVGDDGDVVVFGELAERAVDDDLVVGVLGDPDLEVVDGQKAGDAAEELEREHRLLHPVVDVHGRVGAHVGLLAVRQARHEQVGRDLLSGELVVDCHRLSRVVELAEVAGYVVLAPLYAGVRPVLGVELAVAAVQVGPLSARHRRGVVFLPQDRQRHRPVARHLGVDALEVDGGEGGVALAGVAAHEPPRLVVR